jgi:hypothetical protein
MTREHDRIEYGRHVIDYTVSRTMRKTLEIAVEPDLTVSVAAPMNASSETIRARVRKRAAWILAQRRFFVQFAPRSPEKRYLSGETHLYLGRQYRLKVVKSEFPSTRLFHGRIIVQTRRPENRIETKRLLDQWYADKARAKFIERIEACLQRFPRPASVIPSRLTIRCMRKRWGSMSDGKRLLLNVRLIQAPVDTIDYVITHELCHVLQPSHSPAFFRMIGRIMYDWQRRKVRLEQFLA